MSAVTLRLRSSNNHLYHDKCCLRERFGGVGPNCGFTWATSHSCGEIHVHRLRGDSAMWYSFERQYSGIELFKT